MSLPFEELYLSRSASVPVPSEHVRHFLVNGQLTPWEGPAEQVYSPTRFQGASELEKICIGSFPLLTATEAIAATQSAQQAYANGRGTWPGMTPAARIACIEAFVAGMTAVKPRLVDMLMWEVSKGKTDAEKEIDRTIEYIKLTIAEYKSLVNRESALQSDSGFVAKIRRMPLGVCLVLPPFNYCINEGVTLWIPAILMGNTCVVKMPRPGALANSLLMETIQKAFPAGVVNVLFGSGRALMPPIMQSGLVDVLALIGSSPAAQSLLKQHPRPNRLRLCLGLEAKNPAIVFADADIPTAVRECVSGAFSFSGMRCTAIKVIYVHEDIAEQFVGKLSAAVDALKMGLPWDAGVGITPLPEEGKVEFLSGLVHDAVSKGAKIANASRGGKGDRTFFAPTVLFPVDSSMEVFRVEQFGPVLPVARFSHFDQVLSDLEASPYGQQASVFSTDPHNIGIAVDNLAHLVCRININSQCQRGPDSFPFTARKDSAAATLSIYDALRTFSIRAAVAVKETPQNHSLLTSVVRGDYSNFMSFDYML
eukprot:ANDGO_06816.mRNA.1 NADP-dependent glyceraldehyde-3-phosphate dehydrogenase